MTVVGESKACTRAATWSLLSASPAARKKGGLEWRHANEERRSREETLRGRKHTLGRRMVRSVG
eukprot:1004409-Pleurochrysis_carterae.AAC.1